MNVINKPQQGTCPQAICSSKFLMWIWGVISIPFEKTWPVTHKTLLRNYNRWIEMNFILKLKTNVLVTKGIIWLMLEPWADIMVDPIFPIWSLSINQGVVMFKKKAYWILDVRFISLNCFSVKNQQFHNLTMMKYSFWKNLLDKQNVKFLVTEMHPL